MSEKRCVCLPEAQLRRFRQYLRRRPSKTSGMFLPVFTGTFSSSDRQKSLFSVRSSPNSITSPVPKRTTSFSQSARSQEQSFSNITFHLGLWYERECFCDNKKTPEGVFESEEGESQERGVEVIIFAPCAKIISLI